MGQFGFRSEPTPEVELFWREPDELSIQARMALYYFRNWNNAGISYIGKAGRQTIKQRITCPGKERIFALKYGSKKVKPFVAGLFTSRRKTPKLLDDVERLLIYHINPPDNSKLKSSCKLHHRDLVVICTGCWSYPRSEFSWSRDSRGVRLDSF